MLEPKFEVPNSKNEILPHLFDIHDLTSELILEDCQGVYIFTKRYQVSDNDFKHEIIHVNSTEMLSKINLNEFQYAKEKGANCICTTWCNKNEMEQIIKDALNRH